jgi:hypothetical protein
VAERLFLFLQLEFPWELGPPDGRYLLRGGPEREPEHVVVLNTVGGERRPEGILRGRRRTRPRPAPPGPPPIPVAVTRATVIDPVAVSTDAQAQAWLKQLDAEGETLAATRVLGGVLHAYRIATADPYIHEPSPARALVIRAGWGEGEQVADGLWRHALELPWKEPRAHRRVAALRPQERMTMLLSARETPLLCEELALRARRDLDQGRLAHATVELRSAYAAALAELYVEDRPDLAERLGELRELSAGIAPPTQPEPDPSFAALPNVPRQREIPRVPDEPTVRHALERLEAALRARTAAGFGGEPRPGSSSQ